MRIITATATIRGVALPDNMSERSMISNWVSNSKAEGVRLNSLYIMVINRYGK